VCPEKQILSIYYDGELPAEFNKKIERHIESCVECQKSLEYFKRVSNTFAGSGFITAGGAVSALGGGFFAEDENFVMSEAKSRIRNKIFDVSFGNIENRLGGAGRNNTKKGFAPKPAFVLLKRSVPVPAPFAAAASLLIIFAMLILFYELRNFRQDNDLLSGIPYIGGSSDDDFDYLSNQELSGAVPGAVPAANIKDVIDYLEKADNGSYIRLPERKNFIRYGEPKLIFANDSGNRR